MSLTRGGSTLANMRTVLVKVSPAPTTLSERRAVLGVLKKYAVVDVFKKLHDPSHFISTVAQEQMALSLVAKSPLQFDYAARQGRSNRTTTAPKTFLVKITEKPDYSHKTRIREALIYGRWPSPGPEPEPQPEFGQQQQQQQQQQYGDRDPAALFREDSLPRAALRAACPRDMAWAGLTDWESAGQLDGDGGAGLSHKGDYAQARLMKRGRNDSWFESLAEVYLARHEREESREGGLGKDAGVEEGGAAATVGGVIGGGRRC
ncbi:hypothetical protein C8A01DRAFT_17845 [Parachaetomium inaequale]|uniref:Uncharacterized protein n=1 Tax=Parachaetomium inaequale TaxID=2588326 RepID=A0AAN6SQ04_9PEZI|nr:hypothetical protein C8A01DRAFT_17845 [Parachaetomium inaequale]